MLEGGEELRTRYSTLVPHLEELYQLYQALRVRVINVLRSIFETIEASLFSMQWGN